MLVVAKEFAHPMTTFAPLFTKRVWHHVQVLLVGAILSPANAPSAPYCELWAWHMRSLFNNIIVS
jgi:hypothetical protein